MSLPPELLKKIKLLEISTRKLVNNLFAGEYHSAFRGQGMTFADFREYVPGDDVRNISWSLTARAGKPFIKKYDEERELTLILAVDVSASTVFGGRSYLKGEVIAHLAAILGFSAAKNNDRLGLLMFTDRVEEFVPPKKGSGHVHRVLRDLYYKEPVSSQTRIESAVLHLQSVLKRRSHIFFMSDFLDPSFSLPLRTLAKKHDVVAVLVTDPAELELPKMGLMSFEDPETGETFVADTSSRLVRRLYAENARRLDEHRRRELRQSQVDVVDVKCGEDFYNPLVQFFRQRVRR